MTDMSLQYYKLSRDISLCIFTAAHYSSATMVYESNTTFVGTVICV